MSGFVARTLITAFGLWVADLLLGGIRFDGAGPLFLAALLLGLANAIIRPVVILLTLPITLITLGLFVFVINGAMFLLVARFMPSFHVSGLWPAILASVIVGLTGWIANSLVGNQARIEVWTAKDRGP